MLVERRFGIQSGYVSVDWHHPVHEMVLEPREAHGLADLFQRFSLCAADALPSTFTGSPAIRMKAQDRWVCIHWGAGLAVMWFTKGEAARIADGLREVAYKAERNERGLLPNRHDVDTMEEALVGEGRHRIIQHAPAAQAMDDGGGVRVLPQGSFLSRLIRRPWR